MSASEFRELVAASYEKNAANLIRRGRARGLRDPEDTMHDAYLSILQSGRRVRRLIRYLPKRHLDRGSAALRRQIRRSSRETSLLDEHAEIFGAEDRRLELSKTAEELHEALIRLSPSHRRVLTLHYLESKSLKKVAQICRKSVPCIKSLLFRARLEACVALRRIREIPDSPRNPSFAQTGSTLKPTSRRP